MQNQITFNDYINVLFNKGSTIKSQFCFRSRNHQIYTEKINKIALSSNDNKKIRDDNGINTYPYGYHNNTNKGSEKPLNGTNALLDRINKLKNKSKKRIEESNKLLEECKVINDKIDKTIEKSKSKHDNLIEKVQILNKRYNNMSKDKNILLEDSAVLINKMDKLKDKSKKRIKESNKLLEEYIVINDKIDNTIEKSKKIKDTYDYDILIENTIDLIKRTDDNSENTDIAMNDIKKLNTKVNKLKKLSKKGISESKDILKSYEILNNNADTLINRLKSINNNGIG